MRQDYQEAVMAAVELIAPGKVLAYGDIAELLGTGGPRQVGAVMARSGGAVPWWRVIRASGEPPACHGRTAWEHYAAENTPVRGTPADDGTGYRVRIAEARWQPSAADWIVLDGLRRGLGSAEADSEAAEQAPGGAPAGCGDAVGRSAAGPDRAMSVRHGEVEA
ncbi:MGMT family protein [Arthrobacter sp. Sa2BUA2]|uniref:MGMT family protein n=1 Tax=Arthrobacter pullicola TaxID=2762224 RepID=A0ABR8YIX1_9MICC|nr:MGMT family protein [Arthrobacter pullicola]MBD8044155.1 MGMT family protein [Arthrobacter pullicola]